MKEREENVNEREKRKREIENERYKRRKRTTVREIHPETERQAWVKEYIIKANSSERKTSRDRTTGVGKRAHNL